LYSIVIEVHISQYGATLGGAYGVAIHTLFASPGTESVLSAFKWIFIGLFTGGTLSLLFFGLPIISVQLFSNKGKLSKVIGIILLSVFIGAVYLTYQIISQAQK